MFDYFYGQSGEMFSYFRVPKVLFRDIKFKNLSTDAKTLYGILLDRMGLSVKNGWLDEQGRVYIISPVQEVMDALSCADNKATKLFRELEKFGLIERKRRGLGKPNLIYVKNFADPRFRNREKSGSGAADSVQPEAEKSRGNKTEWNKTEVSEPDPFSSDAEDEQDERGNGREERHAQHFARLEPEPAFPGLYAPDTVGIQEDIERQAAERNIQHSLRSVQLLKHRQRDEHVVRHGHYRHGKPLVVPVLTDEL